MALSNVHSDVEINFAKNRFTNDIGVVKDVYSIRQSLVNLLLTIPGEKPFNRNFGTDINDSLFENYDPHLAAIQSLDIRDKIKLYEPRVNVEHVIINDVPVTERTAYVPGHGVEAAMANNADINLLYVYISYFVTRLAGPGQTLRDAISIGLTKVR